MSEEYPHVITFQSFQPIPDGGGGYEEGWTDFLTTEAFVCPVSSNERYQAQQTQSPISHSIFYPYQTGVKPDMRVIHGDDILTLHSKPIDQGGQGEILMVKAELT